MNVVDSCGWLEYLADGPNAGFFAPVLADPDTLFDLSCLLAQTIGNNLSYGKGGTAWASR